MLGMWYTVYGVLYTAMFVILELDIFELEYSQSKYHDFVVLWAHPRASRHKGGLLKKSLAHRTMNFRIFT